MSQFGHCIIAKLLILMLLTGCVPTSSVPSSVAEISSSRTLLADRVQFIERYVTFQRQYDALEYDVTYINNSHGMVPGPSDWDIRIVAQVPKGDLPLWIPADIERHDDPPPSWVMGLPGALPTNGVTEWYRRSGLEIGVDRHSSIIAYRSTSMTASPP